MLFFVFSVPDIVEILVLGFYPANEMAAFIQVYIFFY